MSLNIHSFIHSFIPSFLHSFFALQSTQYQTGDPVKQEAATKIQTQYRQHAATKEVESMREEEAALKIQAGVRGYMDRQKVRKMK